MLDDYNESIFKIFEPPKGLIGVKIQPVEG